ncbi:MAG: hypothetical protein QM726_18070 [Chitinophagaceae bacterium]
MLKQIISFGLLLLFSITATAQELYVFSEPASNMPAHSVAAKLNYRIPATATFKQRFSPEVMFGLNKDWMLHVSGTFSDFYTPQLRWESVKTYAKYRFYSNDEVHRHFRMAAFAEASYSRSPFYYGDINLDGDNSGIQAGLVATQLINKFAISATASYVRAFANRQEHVSQLGHSINALSYSLSAGYLLLPFSYTDYKQTNLNLYLEAIGMQGLDKSDYMLDLAPALQLIFNSNMKVNLGMRIQASGNMDRIANNSYFVAVERTFLSNGKKKAKAGS